MDGYKIIYLRIDGDTFLYLDVLSTDEVDESKGMVYLCAEIRNNTYYRNK